MNITVREIRGAIETVYPPALALSWDNPGLLCGSADTKVTRVVIALDATDEVVEQAVREGAELVLTHHPMIFKPVPSVNDETAVGRRLLRMIQNGISYYAMHTNFDVAQGGMGDIVAKRLGVTVEAPMEATGDSADGTPVGIGFVGSLAGEALTALELAARVKEQFSIPSVVYYDAGRPIRRIAVCPGSGRGMYAYARTAGADAFITGDMGHHDGIDAVEDGITLIDAGHFGLEHIFVEHMHRFLQERFPALEISENLHDLRKTI